MTLWQVHGQDLQEFKREALNDEQQLEICVVKDPSVLGFDILVIGRQVTTGKRGRTDLFAIERKEFSGIHANQNPMFAARHPNGGIPTEGIRYL
jgi:hypothetical protein